MSRTAHSLLAVLCDAVQILDGLYQAVTSRKREPYANFRQCLTGQAWAAAAAVILPLAFQGQHEFHHVVDACLHTGRDRQIRAVLTALLNGLYQALTTRKREPYSNS
jgi:hypothetical protein